MDEESSNARERPERRCKGCGKPVGDGGSYCPECKVAVRARVEGLLAGARPSGYRPRRPQGRWIVYSMTGIVILLAALASVMVLSMPGDRKFTEQARASMCRDNLRRIEAAAARFNAADGKQPPTGRVDDRHPLVVDQYLDMPPKCPGTRRYYLLEPTDGLPRAECDSGLDGHEL